MVNYLAINPNDTNLSFTVPVPKKLEDKWTISDLKDELIKMLMERLKLDEESAKIYKYDIDMRLKRNMQLYSHSDKPLSYFKDC